MGIRTALRQATHFQHQSLEANPLIATLLDAHITLKQLICIQQALAAYHAAAAAPLRVWKTALDFTPFEHAEVLAADLACLGSAPHPALKPDVPEFTSLADAAGYLYVAEGSLLGNRLIARHLDVHLPEYAQRGGRYYCDDALRIAAYWHPLCALLERLADDASAPAIATARAQRTFADIEACIYTATGASEVIDTACKVVRL
jgi:heme oxygenase